MLLCAGSLYLIGRLRTLIMAEFDLISYKDELKKYEPAILIEDMEDSIYSADFRDIFELMQYIVNSSKNKEEKE